MYDDCAICGKNKDVDEGREFPIAGEMKFVCDGCEKSNSYEEMKREALRN